MSFNQFEYASASYDSWGMGGGDEYCFDGDGISLGVEYSDILNHNIVTPYNGFGADLSFFISGNGYSGNGGCGSTANY